MKYTQLLQSEPRHCPPPSPSACCPGPTAGSFSPTMGCETFKLQIRVSYFTFKLCVLPERHCSRVILLTGPANELIKYSEDESNHTPSRSFIPLILLFLALFTPPSSLLPYITILSFLFFISSFHLCFTHTGFHFNITTMRLINTYIHSVLC